MKQIDGKKIRPISSTEMVETPGLEIKSAVIELESPEAMEKVWNSDGIEVKNQAGKIETRGRFEKPVSLREINVALVDAYAEQQRWPEIRESLDKSRESRIIAVWMEIPAKTCSLKKVIAVYQTNRGEGVWQLWKERFFQRRLLRLKNRECILNPKRKDYKQQLENLALFIEELNLEEIQGIILENNIAATMKNFVRLMKSSGKELCSDCRFVPIGKENLWSSMQGVWEAQKSVRQKYSIVILEGILPDVFSLMEETIERKYQRKIQFIFTFSTRMVVNKIKKYAIKTGLYLLNNENLLEALAFLSEENRKEIFSRAIRNEIRRQSPERKKRKRSRIEGNPILENLKLVTNRHILDLLESLNVKEKMQVAKAFNKQSQVKQNNRMIG